MSGGVGFDWSHDFNDLPADSLGRSKHAEFLTEFLLSKSINSSYVLNINATWGAGKSWFLKRWFSSLEDKYPTVYIDCWINDHSNDPLLTVVSEIKKCLIDKSDKKLINNSGLKKSWRLFKSIAPAATKTIIKNKFGVDFDELDNFEGVDELGEKVVEALIKSHNEANESISEFKKSISEWLNAVQQTQEVVKLPMFVFIDELDRCRPTYAIQMLETVKHIFDIENVVFIIATDKEQLQHSIKAVYGEGFNSSKYLDRFFNRTVTLKQQSLNNFIKKRLELFNPYTVYDVNKSDFLNVEPEVAPSNTCQEILIYIADYYKMDLRTASIWLDRVDSVVVFAKKPVDLFLISYLIATEMIEFNLYETIIHGGRNKDEIYNSINSKYRMDGIELTYSMSGVDESIVPFGKAAYIPDHITSLKFNPLHLISALTYLLRNQCSAQQLDSKIKRLYEKIRNQGRTRGADLDGENISLPNMVTYKLPLLAEINFIDFHHKNGITMDDYRNLCELATTIE